MRANMSNCLQGKHVGGIVLNLAGWRCQTTAAVPDFSNAGGNSNWGQCHGALLVKRLLCPRHLALPVAVGLLCPTDILLLA